jgi:hypothetical protein
VSGVDMTFSCTNGNGDKRHILKRRPVYGI